jgi:Phosphotransferase enzyme family
MRDAVGGSAIVPLPVACLSSLLDWIDQLPGMDAGLARRVRGRLGEPRTVISDTELTGGVVVHADAHRANVLWHEGRLAALLDFEWARIGPPDLELEAACRDDPDIEALGQVWLVRRQRRAGACLAASRLSRALRTRGPDRAPVPLRAVPPGQAAMCPRSNLSRCVPPQAPGNLGGQAQGTVRLRREARATKQRPAPTASLIRPPIASATIRHQPPAEEAPLPAVISSPVFWCLRRSCRGL